MDNLFLTIKDTFEELCQERIGEVAYGILNDFKSECKDPKIVSVLERLVDAWVDSRIGNSPPAQKEKIVIQNVEPVSDVTLRNEPPEIKHQPGTCEVPLKSGPRKGQHCGGTLVGNNTVCKKHLPKVDSGVKCEFIMKSGMRKGQMCGKKVAHGDMSCATHKITKCVFKEGKHRCGKPISKCSIGESHCRIHLINELQLDTQVFILFTNRYGNKEHKYSELVFENKKVVGKQKPDGGILTNLSEEDYECVKVYGLPLDESLVPGMLAYLQKKNIPPPEKGSPGRSDKGSPGGSDTA